MFFFQGFYWTKHVLSVSLSRITCDLGLLQIYVLGLRRFHVADSPALTDERYSSLSLWLVTSSKSQSTLLKEGVLICKL